MSLSDGKQMLLKYYNLHHKLYDGNVGTKGISTYDKDSYQYKYLKKDMIKIRNRSFNYSYG